MGQFSKVLLLAIDNAHTVPEGPGLWTTLKEKYLCVDLIFVLFSLSNETRFKEIQGFYKKFQAFSRVQAAKINSKIFQGDRGRGVVSCCCVRCRECSWPGHCNGGKTESTNDYLLTIRNFL